MTPSPRRPLVRRASTLATTLATTLALAAGTAATASDTVPTPPTEGVDSLDPALATVQSLFTPVPVSASEPAREITMALRDLAGRYDTLDKADRKVADAYLARPTDDSDGDGFTIEYAVEEATPVCTTDLCVHYVDAPTEDDAPPLADRADARGVDGANGVPDYVDGVVRELTTIHDTYLAAGYREPLPDRSLGGDDRFDVYLADIASRGAYGYCATDQPTPRGGQGRQSEADRWAYCVLDNDYAEFAGSALENLRVTAAHEYFHAVQFAYDAFEDQWFLEATATWAEDEVFDEIDDNVQFLRRSPLTAPFVPLDSFVTSGVYDGFHYGTWSFLRFLTEKYRAEKGPMPRLVLDLLRKADGARGAPDLYSWQAVAAVLKRRGTSAAEQFLAFSIANRDPRRRYAEGLAEHYPTGPLRGSMVLSPKRLHTRTDAETDHLTSATYRFTPRRLDRPRTRLRVVLDMADRHRGSLAAVTVVPTRGKPFTREVSLSAKGNGRRSVPFSSRRVHHVEVTLANASARFGRCFEQYTPYSCRGLPKDDGLTQRIRVRVRR
ncbi:MXAN_6640 family putative metalloprotease [Nocardioides sp.]|uniref:MXAN_6640 family putative metalloprotease n=1 Tax=Nocardioides sp. TaxID=35761 RepID=UPI002B27B858|nr:MXAN_6640 family putative metalloprotease [Nocardioides sp.]